MLSVVLELPVIEKAQERQHHRFPNSRMNLSLSCNDTTNSISNGNLSCGTAQPLFPPDPHAQFFKVAFGSSIYMLVVAFITVVANSLLLLVFYVDPFKTFRNPTSYFLIGLSFVDLITGLVQEPIFASCFLLGYLGHPATKQYCPKLVQCGRTLALVTMNASFIIILAFTATQLIVITSPLKYAILVTKSKVFMTVLVIYAYTITFGLLNLVQLPDPSIFTQVDLFLHSFFTVYLAIACYCLLYRAFRRKMASSKSLRSESVNVGRQKSNRVESKFVAVNFFLIFLVFICIQPSAIFALLTQYWLGSDGLDIAIAYLMLDNILYLKFMLDPFVYAWRLPKYRQALRMVLCCGSREQGFESTFSSQVIARMSKSRETVVTLNFRTITE